MDWVRPSSIIALFLMPACGSDPPSQPETDGATETGTTGSSGGADPAPGSAETTSDEPTSRGSTSDPSGADSSTGPGGSGSGTTDGCLVGTDGCPCDQRDACDEGLVCNAQGQCQPAPMCRSVDVEPNDDEDTAFTLSELNCGDMLDLGVLGTLQGPEVDWYRFFGDEGVILCPEQPRVTITADIDADVCVFVDCLEGGTVDVSCGGGSMASDSPLGRPGCCGVNEAFLDSYDCSGLLTPKNVDVWVSVATRQLDCADYAFVYEF
ncbi:MAG: hypothetical protein AAGF11_34820 [Myxococcota bacterium]